MPGHLILIMAPSGSGKGVLIEHIRATFPELHIAISCTTRDPRPNEREGDTYYFTDRATFQRKIEQGAFVEWAEFSGNLYGMLKSEVLEPMREGRVVLREIELQGILSIREIIPEENRTIVYIDAGAWDALARRITARAPMSDEHLMLRKERYEAESKWKAYADVIISNTDGRLEDAKRDIEACVSAILARVANANNDTSSI